MSGPNEADDLDDLRAELARFVLREAGQALAADPDLPLSAGLTKAIREEAARAARQQPTPETIAASVMDTLRPELIDVVRAAADGDAASVGRRRSGLSTPVMAAIAVAALILAFAGGFAVARFVLPAPAPQPEPTQPWTPEVQPAPATETPAQEANSAGNAAETTSQNLLPPEGGAQR